MAKKTKTKKTYAAGEPAVRVSLDEKRTVNFFVRIKPSNAKWMKEQAQANHCNTSVFADSLIQKLKSENPTA